MILLPEDEAKAHDGAHGVVRPGVTVEHLRAEFLSLLDVDEAVLLLIFRRFAERIEIAFKHDVGGRREEVVELLRSDRRGLRNCHALGGKVAEALLRRTVYTGHVVHQTLHHGRRGRPVA